MLPCILNQSVLSVEWCELKAVLSGAKWKSFCCQLVQSKLQDQADAACLAASEFTSKRYFDDERISFDMSLEPHSSHLSFWELINLASVAITEWACLLLPLFADIRGVCRATNQPITIKMVWFPNFQLYVFYSLFRFFLSERNKKESNYLYMFTSLFLFTILLNTVQRLKPHRNKCTRVRAQTVWLAAVIKALLTSVAIMAPQRLHQTNSQTCGYI